MRALTIVIAICGSVGFGLLRWVGSNFQLQRLSHDLLAGTSTEQVIASRVKRSSPHVVISFLHPPSCCDSVIHRIGSAAPRSSLPATSAPCSFKPNDETAIVCV